MSEARKKLAIGMMLAGFPASSTAAGEMIARAFLSVAADSAVEAIEASCRSYMRGEVPGQSLTFCPSTAEFAQRLELYRARLQTPWPRIVSYPLGGKPPAGFVALETWKEGGIRASVDMRPLRS